MKEALPSKEKRRRGTVFFAWQPPLYRNEEGRLTP